MSRRMRTLLPTATRPLKSQVVEGEKIVFRRQRAKHFYDRGSKEPPELKIGQPAQVKPCHPKEIRSGSLFLAFTTGTDPGCFTLLFGIRLKPIHDK